MTLAPELARVLAHDVGKYVARAARNLPEEGDVPPVLAQMLVRDVFGMRGPSGDENALQRFDRLTSDAPTDALGAVRERLVTLVGMEAELRAGRRIREAAAQCLAVDAALRALLPGGAA